MIKSIPSNAKIYVDGQPMGTTPYRHEDTKIVGSTTTIMLEKEGFETLNTSFSRDEQADVGAIIGGLFIMIPFLWAMKYNPNHIYELQPIAIQNQITQSPVANSQNNNSVNELLKLKDLLDQQAITNEDFTTLKVKILNDQYDYNDSVSDQITKLKSLLDSNLLTKEEYNSQKSKLINGK
jgi:hypothetical protein